MAFQQCAQVRPNGQGAARVDLSTFYSVICSPHERCRVTQEPQRRSPREEAPEKEPQRKHQQRVPGALGRLDSTTVLFAKTH